MRNVNIRTNKRLSVSVFKYLLLAIVLILILLAVLNRNTLAKYAHGEDQKTLYVADNFYFVSNYLKPRQDNGQYVAYTLRAGVDTITFELRNYEDELRSSEIDISYKIYLDGKEQQGKGGKLLMSDSGATATVDITGLKKGTYTVTAVTTAPYSTTIGAQFTIVETTPEIEYTAYGSADSPIMLLTVNTNDYSGNIIISWDASKVYPDKTDPLLETAVATNGSTTVELSSNSEYTFRFFKSDLSKDYTGSLSAITAN